MMRQEEKRITMKTSRTGSEFKTPAVALRRRAEGIAREKAFRIPENMESLSVEAARQILHELRVHQIELEMQNEELRRTQAELDAARARYFDLYDLASVGYFTLSDQGLILEANYMAASLLGVAKSALVKQPIFRFILPEDQDIYYLHRTQLFETHSASSEQAGEPQACELRMVKSDGTAFWAHLAATAAQDADGEPVCRVVLNDITERKQTETALRESEERYRALFDRSLDLVYITDFEGRFIDANDAALNRLGYTREAIHTLNFASLLSEDQLPLAFKTLQEIRETGIHKSLMDFRLRHKNGSDVYVETRGSTVMSNGTPVAIQGIARDITERKQAEDALRESETLFRKLFEDTAVVKLIIDMDTGNIIDANEAAAVFYGWSREQLKQMKIQEINTLSPEEVKKVMEKARTKKKIHLEFRHRRADGSVRDVDVFSSNVEVKGKNLLHVIIHDITDRNRAEEKLKDTLESLRRAVGVTVQVMVSAVETRDPYTAGHQLRSANLACAIATEMGLPQEKIDGIRMAGSIHDIGKLSIPAEILSKPTKLTNIEFSLIKEHAQKGYEMLKDVESPWPLAQIVYQHHERMNGTGYPRNLKGDDILMEARIMAVADVVEAMASHRPYRPALGIDAALAEIQKNRGTLYDDAVVDACLRLFREKGFKLEGT
jgi:PAS domain S-box-containing protein/putative nucleotidyltransferase with HDIG domain